MYLYKAIVYKIPNDVAGITASEVIAHQTDKIDFEANFKSTAIKVDELVLAETTFVISKTYTQFKTLIDGVLRVWSDAKYTEDSTRYILNVLTTSPI